LKYVTFHWHICGGVSSLKVHENKEAAIKYFNKNAYRYFELGRKTKIDKFPASYGFSHRKFMGMSKYMFEKNFGKIEVKEE